ncbi:MAG TPA: hypothetical protein VK654_06350 [Nitrospirota bacterium]|nr:hypothetical protein [Nitrospirota bacterium]
MQRADLTTRTVAAFVDFLVVLGLARLPDVIGVLAAAGYILLRDGLFDRSSIGKKLTNLRMTVAEDAALPATYRESIIRNAPLAAAYLLFLIPYAGWVLCPLVVVIEWLAAIGDEQGMRVGDLLARTRIVQSLPDEAVGRSMDKEAAGAEQDMRLP